MENLENFLCYILPQYDIEACLLAFSTAAMAVSLICFLTISYKVLPNYRTSSTIRGIVMITAFLELSTEWELWESTFDFKSKVRV